MPYEQAWGILASLSIANMDFEEWADEDAGVQADGLYKWVGPFPQTNDALIESERGVQAKRDAALKAMRDLGHVD